jgi:tRNA (guanine37-N1)-methyltransferase
VRIDVVTIFPRMVEGPLSDGIVQRAREAGLVDLRVHDLRDHTDDRHRTVDDAPFGGGPGMVMKAEPFLRAVESLVPQGRGPGDSIVLLSPRGRVFEEGLARRLAARERLILLCGRYEGIDERVAHLVTDRVSIGPYVLSGGEIAAMATLDAVTRKLPGVISNPDSIVSESHAPELEGGAEYPHYTRPAEFRGWEVPEVLRSGHHAAIERWRAEQVRKR